MKTTKRKYWRLGIVFAMCMAMIMPMFLSVTVQAKVTYDKTQIFYRTSKDGYVTSQGVLQVQCTKASEKIKKSTLKSSKKSVAEIYMLEKVENFTKSQVLEAGLQGNATNTYRYNIGLELKKAGTTKISYKIGNKKYTTKVTVKNYANPIKKLTITNVNSGKNLASNFKRNNLARGLEMSKKTKAAKVYVVANKNWKIESVMVQKMKSNNLFAFQDVQKEGVSKVNLGIGVVKAKEPVVIAIRMIHKSGGSIECQVLLNEEMFY